MLVIFMALVYAGYTLFLKSDSPREPVKRPKQVDSAPTAPPDEWSQRYDIIFNYGKQIVNVKEVSVRGLNSRLARISYQMVVTPNLAEGWIRDRGTWTIAAPGKRKRAERISVQAVGRQNITVVRFSWPSNLLEKGSYLRVDIPTYTKRRRRGKQIIVPRKITPVKLGLEVPEDHKGIAQRQGSGGL